MLAGNRSLVQVRLVYTYLTVEVCEERRGEYVDFLKSLVVLLATEKP